MALRDQPYLPLYVQDFLTDEKLIECSAAAHGVYIKIMCLMHKSQAYGKIMLRSLPKDLPQQNEQQIQFFAEQFAEQFVKHLPFKEIEICRCLVELLTEKVLFLEIVGGVFLCQKRMVKDNEISVKRSKSGKKGAEVTNQLYKYFAAAKSPANTENEYEYEIKEILCQLREIEDTVISPELEKLFLMIVLKIFEAFQKRNPNYFFHKETDYKACLQIAYNIAETYKWKRSAVINGQMDECVEKWENILEVIQKDTWFSSRSLTDIATIKEWQRIVQKLNGQTPEGSKPKKKMVD